METVIEFVFMGSETTADSDCSHKIKRHLLLGRKPITHLDSILKNRGILNPQIYLQGELQGTPK